MSGPDADERWMREALALADRAAAAGEVPVGALVTLDGEAIGAGFNCSIQTQDPSAHAEIVALREAAARLGNYRLPGATLYVTLEPCLMCVGAMVAARLARLVFGAHGPKSGGLGGAFDALALPGLNHRFAVAGGICAEPCGARLRDFFQARRGLTT